MLFPAIGFSQYEVIESRLAQWDTGGFSLRDSTRIERYPKMTRRDLRRSVRPVKCRKRHKGLLKIYHTVDIVEIICQFCDYHQYIITK